VTTGLISQLSSEAQLAFILSHEIAHYEQKHTHKEYLNFKRTGKIKNKQQIRDLSQFSKENELEADRLALVRYHKLGYSSEELIGTFDLLMYSYLPFDEVAFPPTYFNTPNLYIPKEELDLEIKPITAEENYNDTYSSHPNIKKRKDAIQLVASEYSNWGNNSFILSKEQFEYIRTICRFESVRTSVIEGSEFSALYSIFLLEKQFPKSIYLDRMKVLSWLSIVRLQTDFEKTKENKEIEGESSFLYNFLSGFKNKERAIIGLRVIYDLRAKHPEDTFFDDSYEFYLKELSRNDWIKLSDYQPLNFHQAAVKALTKEPVAAKEDSLTLTTGSKYSRIKEKRALRTLVFDSTNFIAYAIPDIITDSLFLKKIKEFQNQADSIQEATNSFHSLSEKEQEKAWKIAIENAAKHEPGFKDILVVEPKIQYYSKQPTPDWQAAAYSKTHLNTLLTNAKAQGFHSILIFEDSIHGKTTDAFNEYLTYLTYLGQIVESNEGRNCLSADYEILNNFTSGRGTSVLLFTMVDYSYFPDIMNVDSGKSLDMYSLVMNSKTGKCYSYAQTNVSKAATPANYGPHYTNLFKLIRQF
jgi:hypothetical protein